METKQAVSKGDLEILARVASTVSLHRGELLFEEGEPEDAVYVIQNGKVAVGHPEHIHHWVDFGPYGTVDIPESHEKAGATTHLHGVGIQSSGTLLGDHGMFGHGHYGSSALCQTDCNLLRMDDRQLANLGILAPKLFKQLSEEIENH
ncbi:MAG: cyclic nucleotide-binding domain-containing protein [Nitrospirae bacterium]|nr:cyclic nucleotide-binding domain-containing protein [Magnetococcales bacterium]